MITHIHHTAIICSNYEISKAFYVHTLGCKIIKETYRKERDSYKLDLSVGDSGQIELFSFPDPPLRPTQPEARGLRHLAFGTDDIEAAIGTLSSKGVECEPVRVDELTGKRFTFFRDPDNLPLELYEV
ncbi:VOC family protein [Bacillus sp. FJAT-42376]|uniref:SMU1112c/YaeR family gloxylase I-like metalloprotein n=1 Tax=Bacillus sp. FJAT-42376 TaxID=2014076 RepID=UPI000F50AB90|nr:VOC family protein [Bacillus sp. FJAT-42376]AZB40923.1 VOC family protein [Bacillus sp. FJAT-42376]